MHNRKLYNQIINSISKVVKKQINEAFDFGTINKQGKNANVYDIIYPIIKKIANKKKIADITDAEYNLLITYTGIYKARDKGELYNIIKNSIKYFGNECNLNWIDVSNITDMYYLFRSTKFNGDISEWNVSNVTRMEQMFAWSEFNGDISKWDVSNVKDMGCMFTGTPFNGDISQWDVSNVRNMSSMFHQSEFNGDISQWDVSNVREMYSMFSESKFNGDISQWDVRNVTDMEMMFSGSLFNGDISNWNINTDCNIDDMFKDCSIKEEYKPKKMKINESFNFSSVNKSKKPTNIYSKFYNILGKSYNEITEEDKEYIKFFPDGIYKVQDKEELKKIIKRTVRLLGYDCNLNWIDVSNVTDMSNLFQNSKFNGDISRWDVSNVTNMSRMFMNSLFNGDISKWDVSSVTNMHCMFHNTGFNNDISSWDVSNVIYMSGMFDNTPFNKDISNWKINPNCKIDFIFADCPIEEQYKPKEFRL